ncbi:MAG: hypothetical protein Q7T53_09265 [Deltaproteobacteria bacterium]|nr:hypothetical protein [Deltaproteobacteria bacterium]
MKKFSFSKNTKIVIIYIMELFKEPQGSMAPQADWVKPRFSLIFKKISNEK